MTAYGESGQPPDPGISRGHEHVHVTVQVDIVGSDGISDGLRHGAERGLVENVIRAFHRVADHSHIPHVPLDQTESRPSTASLDKCEVLTLAGRKIIEDADRIALRQDGRHQVGPDKTCTTGNEEMHEGAYRVKGYARGRATGGGIC